MLKFLIVFNIYVFKLFNVFFLLMRLKIVYMQYFDVFNINIVKI